MSKKKKPPPPPRPELPPIKHEDWLKEGQARFGADIMKWKFVCPVCGYIQSVQDYKDAKAPQSTVAFSCVGRWIEGSKEAFTEKKKGPCTYAGGGLIGLNPLTVLMPDGGKQRYFEFAPADPPAPAAAPAERAGSAPIEQPEAGAAPAGP